MNILVVEDEQTWSDEIKKALTGLAGLSSVSFAKNRDDAIARLELWPDAVILDAVFPTSLGDKPIFNAAFFLDGLSRLRNDRNWPEILLISSQKETTKNFDEVIDWLADNRISYFLPKSSADIGWQFFQALVKHTIHKFKHRINTRETEEAYTAAYDWFKSLSVPIITRHHSMLTVKTSIEQVARAKNIPVLILAEIGTGKESLARAIHEKTAQGAKIPFIAKDCGTLKTELIKDELFGHMKGAFTGAVTDKAGIFEVADKGTLFLDEIHNLDLTAQAMLLRVLQEREVTRAGSHSPRKFEVRTIAATSKDLVKMMQCGEFNDGLFYRLKGIEINLPPLRERKSDIAPLAQYFLARFNIEYGGTAAFADGAISSLEAHNWPGNIRELEHFIQRVAVSHIDGVVDKQHIDQALGVGSYSTNTIHHVTSENEIHPDPEGMADFELGKSAEPSVSSLPIDPQQVVELLLQEIAAPEPRNWLLVGPRSNTEDEKREHGHEPLIRQILMSLFDEDSVNKLSDALKTRDNNDPRRINVYKALLYLALAPSHTAPLEAFGRITGLRTWASEKKIGDELVHLLPHLVHDQAEQEGEGTTHIYELTKPLVVSEPKA